MKFFLKKDKQNGITPEQMRNLIIELGLPDSILELFDGNCKIEHLQYDFKDPNAILHLSKEQQDVYSVNRYKPILAYAFENIFAYDTVSQKYVNYSIELFNENELVPMSWDSLFIEYIECLYECELPDDEIISYGKILGVRHTELILNKIKEALEIEMSFPEFGDFIKALRLEIDNMCSFIQ